MHRWGLRAVRVGVSSGSWEQDSSDPMIERQRSMDRSDLETEKFGVRLCRLDVAQEEHMVPSTVPASGVLRVARLCGGDSHV